MYLPFLHFIKSDLLSYNDHITTINNCEAEIRHDKKVSSIQPECHRFMVYIYSLLPGKCSKPL